jgi:predicted dehydrogenase
VNVAPVRWGLLSTARINGAVIAGARESEHADVVAVASRDGGRAREFAERFGIPRAHGSYEELLADPEVDAIYVSLPNGMHVDWSIRALEAGKHVLCEKPMARRPEAVARAFDVAEREGLVLSEAFMWRHNPQTRRLQELLAEGVVGDVRLVRASFSFPLVAGAPNVRLDAALDGGAMLDVGCYCVSGARLAAGGEPHTVAGAAVTGPSGVDTRFAGMLRFDGDVLATFDCGIDMTNRHELEIAGSHGRIVLADPWHARTPLIAVERDGDASIIEVQPADSYRLELEDMAAAIRGEHPPLLGREDAIGQARAIAALELSASEGSAVALGT